MRCVAVFAAWEGCLPADYKANLRGHVTKNITNVLSYCMHSALSLFVTALRFMLLQACVTALAVYALVQLLELQGEYLELPRGPL